MRTLERERRFASVLFQSASNGYFYFRVLPYASHNPPEKVLDTLLHEIAHALAGPKARHGPVWKAIAKKLGATPRACDTCDETVVMPGDWQAICGACNKTYHQIQTSAATDRIPLSVCRTEGVVVSVCRRSSTSAFCPTDGSTISHVGSKMCRVPYGSSSHPQTESRCMALSLSSSLRTGLAILFVGC